MSVPPPLDSEELLAQVGWVRALAREVVRDAHGADDLAQGALLVALTPGVECPRSVRGWLAAVIANLQRTASRGESRRARREHAVARPEATPSTLELVERASTQRALVGALLELDEPYRSTLLLRFFEECSPGEIAARMGAPESTVATRTAEGLKRLRARLARGDGRGERTWGLSILPLLRWPKAPPPPGALLGALALNTYAKLIAGGALVAAAFLASRALLPSGATPAGDASIAAPEGEALPEPAARPLPERAPVARLEAAPDATEPEAAAGGALAASAATEPIRGRVIDLEGLPVAGVDVCRLGLDPPRDSHHAGLAHAATRCAPSGADGRFELDVARPARLTVRSERYATVFEGVVQLEATQEEPLVVVAWRIPLGGVVVDETGAGIAGAEAIVRGAGRLLELPGNLLGASSFVARRARTDEAGLFAFSDAAELGESALAVEAPGFLPTVMPIPAGGDPDLRVVLRRTSPGSSPIVGHVVLPDRSPAAGALVSAGTGSVTTDRDGLFVLDLGAEPAWAGTDRDQPRELVAVRAGYLPAKVALPSIAEAEEKGWPRDLVLELGGAPLAIRGRVVDEKGAPLAGISVRALDATSFGLVAGPEPGWFTRPSVEELLGGGEAHTDARGAFELAGLLAREYRLEALEPQSLLTIATEPVAAGSTGVTIVVDRTTLGRIAGRIVDRVGVGILGVRISVSSKGPGRLEIGRGALTDAEGRFALEGVTTRPAFLRLEGDPIVPELFRALPPGVELDELELAVGRRCHLQVDWDAWIGRADELRVIDEDGAPLELMNLEGDGFGPRPSILASPGLSSVYAVSDAAAHALLMRGDEEVERVRLHPVPGELELLRP